MGTLMPLMLNQMTADLSILFWTAMISVKICVHPRSIRDNQTHMTLI
jgi:hypothetical protein